MSADQLVRRYVETINEKDTEGFADLFAVDAVLHDPFFPEPTKGRDAIRAMIEGVLGAFSDMRWTQVGRPVESDGRVAFVVGVAATNDGPLAMPGGTIPATGKAMSFESGVFWTVDSDGFISEERSYFDATGVAGQLGLTG